MEKLIRRLRAVVMVVFLVSAAALAGWLLAARGRSGEVATAPMPGGGDPTAPEVGASDLRITEFRLVDQEGSVATTEIFSGEVTIVNLFFTHCPLACPRMAEKLEEITGRINHTDCRIVSISIDPKHDTVERMRDFASRYRIERGRWRLLTGYGMEGGQEQVLRLAKDGLKTALTVDSQLKLKVDGSAGGDDEGMMDNIVHSEKLFLVGRNGHVLGVYSSNDDGDVDRLVDRVKALSRR